MMQDAYIIAGSRSAVGKATKGTLRDVRPCLLYTSDAADES